MGVAGWPGRSPLHYLWPGQTMPRLPGQDGRLVLFLDDGGVISDNDVRAPQWQALAGDCLLPRPGGTPALWAEANRVAVGAPLAEWEEGVRADPLAELPALLAG